MTKKKAPKMMKCVDCKKPNYKQNLNFDIEKAIKPNTINPKEIFDAYVAPPKKQTKKLKPKK
tara:strand:- start:523 stop:708 length:186 start_codon:yes stop_codon:yes gene_type:complete